MIYFGDMKKSFKNLLHFYSQLSKPPMGNKLGHGEPGGHAEATYATGSDQRPPSGAATGRPPPAAPQSTGFGSGTTPASGSGSVAAVHNKKVKAGLHPSSESHGGHHAQDCDDDDEQVEVPAPMEPMAPIPVSNSDKLGLPGIDPSTSPGGGGGSGSAATPSSPSLNKPNDSCDSVDATDINSSDLGGDRSSGSVINTDSVEKAIQERSYRLQELLDSERVYVCDLQHCCQYIQYMRESKEKEDHEIPMPEDLREGKDRMIFGNIEAIYEWHRE